MKLDEDDWYPEDAPQPARIVRYQLAAMDQAAFLRIETGLPGDLELTTDGQNVHQLALLAENCRQLGRHLLQCADYLDSGQKRKLQ